MSPTDNTELAARNKQLAREFYGLVFVDHQRREAAAHDPGPRYVQHHAEPHDGPQAFIEFCEGYFARFPAVRPWIKRILAEGNLVVLHSESRRSPEERRHAIMDILRVENGKIVEHWDVMRDMPESNSNSNRTV